MLENQSPTTTWLGHFYCNRHETWNFELQSHACGYVAYVNFTEFVWSGLYTTFCVYKSLQKRLLLLHPSWVPSYACFS